MLPNFTSDIIRIIIPYVRLGRLEAFFFKHNIDSSFKFSYDGSCYSSIIISDLLDKYKNITIIGIRMDASIQLELNIWTSLRKIRMMGYKMNGFNCLKECINLKHVIFDSCDIVEVPDLGGCKYLRIVEIVRCYGLKNINGLFGCERLKILVVKNCGITSLRGGIWPKLRYLNLCGCASLISLDGLQICDKLRIINLTDCKKLQNLNGLCVPNLRILMISECCALNDISSVTRCHNLHILFAGLQKNFIKIPVVEWANLKFISLGYSRVEDITNLETCHKLEYINLTACENLRWLPDFAKFKKLKYISLDKCGGIKSVVPLLGCEKIYLGSQCDITDKHLIDKDTIVGFNTWGKYYESVPERMRSN